MEKSLPQQKEDKMPYNQQGDWIDEQEEMDRVFKLLSEEQEIDEDDLRFSPKITRLVKDVALDTGVDWDELVAACDEKFGTLEARAEEIERLEKWYKELHARFEKERFYKELQERLKDEN